MKKLLSLFVPLMALFLTLSPQTARADVDFSTKYLKVQNTSSTYTVAVNINFIGNWTTAEIAALNIKYQRRYYNGTEDGTDKRNTTTQTFSSIPTAKKATKGNYSGCYYSSLGSLSKAASTATATNDYVAFWLKADPDWENVQITPSHYFQIAVRVANANGSAAVRGNIMSMLYNDNFTGKTVLPCDYCFYRFFNSYIAGGAESGNYAQSLNKIDFSNLVLPATTLTQSCYADMFTDVYSYVLNPPAVLPAVELAKSCYEGMFTNCSAITATPEIKALSLKNCSGDIADCCKNMFKGCSNLTTVTTNFLAWGSTNSPTENWITSTKAITFNCPSSLTETKDANHMGSNGTKNASVTPNAYVFDVATNSGTWDGTCSLDKYYTTAIADVATIVPAGTSFNGWYTAGDVAAPSSLSAPSGMTTYYAKFSSATNHRVTIDTYSSVHGTVTVSWNDGSAHSFTSGYEDIAENTSLTISATPNTGYTLTGITITPSGESAVAHTSGDTYTLTKDITVAASFATDECSISIANPTPAGYGTISVSDGINSYTVGQTHTFNRQNDNGKVLTVTAVPEDERVFSSWVGGLTQTGTSPYTATYTIGASTPSTLTIGATFDVKKYTINATSSHGTVNLTAGGYDAAVNTGNYAKNVTVTLTPVADDFYAFARWSDGNTDNPRTITISDNLVLSAVFEVHPQSDPASVDVYQVGTGAGGKKIVYDLSPTTDVNNSSITYTPIDMGYGVAWADRNIGATSATAAGGLFYWGGLTPISSGWPNNSYYSGINDITDRTLPLAADAAYQTMGGNTWRVPTKTEWEALLNTGNTNLSSNFTGGNYNARKGNGTITSKTVPANTITLPQVAIVRDQSYTQLGDWCNYWSASLSSDPTGGTSSPYVLYAYNAGQTLTAGASLNPTPVNVKCLFPIRAIYSPRFSQNTLTIRTINGGTTYTYIYICEYGQEVTVTANANTGDNYVFNEWNDHTGGATRTFTVTADATYTATFTQATTYAITFVDEDGSTILDGPKDVVEGVVPTYNGETPTKAATAQYTYTFDGWSPTLYAADKAQTYTATYSSTVKQYTLNVEAGDNGSVSGGGIYDYGTNQEITATADDGYHFVQWQDGNTDNPRTINVTNVTAATTYTATFAANTTPEIELYDNSDASVYTNLLSTYAGQAVNVTLKRTFNANRWATLCLPFDFDTYGSALDGRVYELLECNVDNQTGMTITFALAPYENGVDIVAGKPYLVLIDNKLTDPRFEGVTLTSFTPLTVSKTYVNFVANIPQTTLTEKEDIFINNNRLYYPKAGGSPLRAFRAYLHIKNANGMQYAQPRVRLVVRGESGETIDVMSIDEDAEPETLKYIENGILIIERGGVRYDAQGKKLE